MQLKKYNRKNGKGDADFLFETDFENYIKNKLINNEFDVFQSLYLPDFENNICQIDLVAIKDSTIYCIECKSHYGKKWCVYKRKDWIYTDKTEKLYTIKNPILQNKKHCEALYKLCLPLEEKINNKYRTNFVVNITPLVVCKADIGDKLLNNIDACHYTDMNKKLKEKTNGTVIDTYFHHLLYPLLSKYSDTSEDRLQQHINYLKKHYGFKR